MLHTNYETLVNYIENTLPEAERVRVENHLAQPCAKCNRMLTRLHSFFKISTADLTVAPSKVVLQRAISIQQQRMPAPVSFRERLMAALQFDSRLQLSSARVRGAARSRQMLFATPTLDIDLQLTPERDEHTVFGQILGLQQAGAHTMAFVSLYDKSGRVLQGTETDAQGQFSFRKIDPGVYDIIFDLENQEVAILDLELIND